MLEDYSILTEELYNELQEYHNYKLPDPEQYPIIFKYMINMFLFHKQHTEFDG